MLYTLNLSMECYHEPTQRWHTYYTTRNVRAVSRKHALNKGLKVVRSWPGFSDRDGHPDWRCYAEATIGWRPLRRRRRSKPEEVNNHDIL